MRYLRMFLLHLQYVFEHRSKSFVYFLIAVYNPLILLLFWRAAIASNQNMGITLPFIASYYLLLTVAGSLLQSHVEVDVGYEDIHHGQLSVYLLKPFSYFWINFIEEAPYRILQGIWGIGVLLIFVVLFPNLVVLANNTTVLLLALCIAVLAYFLSFLYKMNLGLLTFWTIDTSGLSNLSFILTLVFAGFVMPISFFPSWLATITYFLPFPYVVYFPVVAFQGKLTILQLLQVVGVQCVWIMALYITYRTLWSAGLKKFTAVGR